jgi:hypothetical protein
MWHPRCPSGTGGSAMLMFKRAQIYIAIGLAALAEILVRAFAH